MFPKILHVSPLSLTMGHLNEVAVVVWNPASARAFKIVASSSPAGCRIAKDTLDLSPVADNGIVVARFQVEPLTVARFDITFAVYDNLSFGTHPVLAEYTATFYSQVATLGVSSPQPEVLAMQCQWRPLYSTDWTPVGQRLSNMRAGLYTIEFQRPGLGRNFTCLIKSSDTVYVPPAGATWRLTKNGYDSGEQYSGSLLEALSAGTYSIAFAAVSGWTAPATQPVIIPDTDAFVSPDNREVSVANGVEAIILQDFTLTNLGCLTVQYEQL